MKNDTKLSFKVILILLAAFMTSENTVNASLDKSQAKVDDVNSIDPSQIEVALIPEKETIMLGEPIYLSFIVRNKSERTMQIVLGGDYRNRLGRPESFSIDTVDADGQKVSQPEIKMSFGGLTYSKKIPAKGQYTLQLFLPSWATFQKVGSYAITANRILELNYYVPDRNWTHHQHCTKIPVKASAKISVIPLDKVKMDELIDRLGKEMFSTKIGEGCPSAGKLAAVDNERVVPYFLKVLKEGPYDLKFGALNTLARFNNDDAFEGLKYALKVEGKDFIGGAAATMEVADSFAKRIKQAAVHAISRSPHPESVPSLLSMRNDSLYQVRLTVVHKLGKMDARKAVPILQEMKDDKNELVRNEARRYLKEFSLKEQ